MKILLLIALPVFLAACGSENGMREITLISSLINNKSVSSLISHSRKNLDLIHDLLSSNKLSNPLLKSGDFRAGTSCLQPHVFSATHIPDTGTGASTGLYQRFPIEMRNETLNSYPTTWDEANMIDYLNGHTTLEEPIKVQIPKGRTMEVGILGVLYEPHDQNSNDICDDNIVPGYSMPPAYNIIGHVTVPATSASNTIYLKTWLVKANPTTGTVYCDPSPDPNDHDKQNCPEDEFSKIIPNSNPAGILEIEPFADGAPDDPHALLRIDLPASSTFIWTVDSDPIRFRWSSGGSVIETVITTSGGPVPSPIPNIPFSIQRAL